MYPQPYEPKFTKLYTVIAGYAICFVNKYYRYSIKVKPGDSHNQILNIDSSDIGLINRTKRSRGYCNTDGQWTMVYFRL